MGDKCTPAAPNQLLTGILALLMQSSCLFRLNAADNAAYTPRYTDAQPCRPAPCMLQKAKFAQVSSSELDLMHFQVYVSSSELDLMHFQVYDTDNTCPVNNPVNNTHPSSI